MVGLAVDVFVGFVQAFDGDVVVLVYRAAAAW
jgi:hypothetical protein